MNTITYRAWLSTLSRLLCPGAHALGLPQTILDDSMSMVAVSTGFEFSPLASLVENRCAALHNFHSARRAKAADRRPTLKALLTLDRRY